MLLSPKIRAPLIVPDLLGYLTFFDLPYSALHETEAARSIRFAVRVATTEYG